MSQRSTRPTPWSHTCGSTRRPRTSAAIARAHDSKGLAARPSAARTTRSALARPVRGLASAAANSWLGVTALSRRAESATHSATSKAYARAHPTTVSAGRVTPRWTCIGPRSCQWTSSASTPARDLLRGSVTVGRSGGHLTFQPWSMAALRWETVAAWDWATDLTSARSPSAYVPRRSRVMVPAASSASTCARVTRQPISLQRATPPKMPMTYGRSQQHPTAQIRQPRTRRGRQPAKPCGFCDCQRHVSAAISSTDLCVRQPSSRLALPGSAYDVATSPGRRATTS